MQEIKNYRSSDINDKLRDLVEQGYNIIQVIPTRYKSTGDAANHYHGLTTEVVEYTVIVENTLLS
jgi:hypothetical protein